MTFGALSPHPLRLGGSDTHGWSPEQHARLCADLVAVKRTAPLARLYCNQDSGSPFAASVTAYFGQNGAGLIYAPTVSVTGAGDVTLTWPNYWTDEFNVQYPVRIRQAIARAHSASARFTTATVTGSTVRVRVVTDSGAAAGTPFSLRIW